MLRAANLRFAFARQTYVVDDVSIDVRPGGLVGILGPNGSGKTTLLRLLCGTLRPESGRVTLDGRDLREIPRTSLAQRLAVVPQETHLAFEYSVLEIALMGRYPHLGAFEVEGPDDVAAALAALEATGTRALADRPFQTLSGGEKQRVIIASALAQLERPRRSFYENRKKTSEVISSRVLFLDEPTASLDLRYQVEIAKLIKDLHHRSGVSIVLSTHDLHFAFRVCDEVILLREGRVLAHGQSGDVLTANYLSTLYDVDPAEVQWVLSANR